MKSGILNEYTFAAGKMREEEDERRSTCEEGNWKDMELIEYA